MFYLTNFGVRMRKEGFHLIKDNWDDYGFETLYRLYFVTEELKTIEIGYVKIGYKGQEGRTNLKDDFEFISEEYFSLGQSSKFYSKLRKLGDEIRLKCLMGLRDIAYNEELYNEVIDESVVQVSLLRDLNKRNVERQFRRIAHGGAILTPYNLELSLQTEDKVTKFQFNVIPEVLPPTNIHAIIGTNGSGKTTTLKKIVDGYLKDNLNEEFSNAIFVSFSIFDKNNYYEATDIQKEYYYVGANTQELKTKSQEDLRREFYTSINNIFSKKRHYYLCRMLEILEADYNLSRFNLQDIVLEFISTSQDKEAVKKYSSILSEVFDKFSSGHQIVLLSITKIVELIVEKTLILIDEPETHLHPPLLSAFIRAISEIIIAENAVAILATHSPVVLQEVPKSCVSIIRKHGAQTTVSRPRFETFGENVGVLTEEVFGLEVPKTGFHTLLRKIVQENPDYNKVLELFNNELSIEAKSIIRTYISEINR
ncbi:AAA family ATPase [Priestia filamentosa]|uniref:AAA family ATPase n=1 Tax=Priestia filamentosa TaxID=1402861 RepID=UPI002E1C7746|nr:AAA family ATPase [Priestia filamentosa]MED3727085.1 AAA family ATPase [Priestia filamentosa]